MELSILERINLLNVMPVEGDLVSMRVVKKLRDDLGFSEEEIKSNQITSEDNQIKWRETGYTKEVSVGEKAVEVIKAAFEKLDQAGKFREDLIPLYDKIAGPDDAVD